MMEKQKTISKPVTVSGTGLHTGQNVTLTYKPAPVNFGYKFKRVDIENSPLVPADADLVCDTSRGTSLEYKGVKIGTVEHVLAAVFGLGIDNIIYLLKWIVLNLL